MTAQEYITSQLEDLNVCPKLDDQPKTRGEMGDVLFRILMSKKFRKFSVPEENQRIIKTAIRKNIENDEPIKITWPYGAYKLWRLEETPEPDWAELFTIMYIVRWLKPVCAMYPKGVVFTFWSDEVVISAMNNIPQSDLDTYREHFDGILSFIKPYLPSNFEFEVFLERSQYESKYVFDKELMLAMEELERARGGSQEPLAESVVRSIEMNVKLTPEQEKNPKWREKIDLMHNAYYNLQSSKNYARLPYSVENIAAFTVFFEPNVIPIGSTKTSIVRFWVGVGALTKRNGGFIEAILSPSQLETAAYTWEDVRLGGLEGKNFNKIRVLEN